MGLDRAGPWSRRCRSRLGSSARSSSDKILSSRPEEGRLHCGSISCHALCSKLIVDVGVSPYHRPSLPLLVLARFHLCAFRPPVQTLLQRSSKLLYIVDDASNQATVRGQVKTFMRDGASAEEHDWMHAFHCLNIIREELMCRADDSLLASARDPRNHSSALRIGHGQYRRCGRWEDIRDWTVSSGFPFARRIC